MQGHEKRLLSACCGILFVAFVMVAESRINSLFAGSASCIDAVNNPCNGIFGPSACTSTNCQAVLGGGFVCSPGVALVQNAPNNSATTQCATVNYDAANQCNPGVRPPANCGVSTGCTTCALNMAGLQVCQPTGAVAQLNSPPGDGVMGGACQIGGI
jgi:hypothetical protein